jgi:hypothetical protein
MKKRLLDVSWIVLISTIGFFIFSNKGKIIFIDMTLQHPLIMGFFKFAILATMGELLSRRLIDNVWKFRGLRYCQRALVWGLLGVLITFVFSIYSTGVESLVSKGLLSEYVPLAFWCSFWMNILFAFPMMVVHRITDTLIDRGLLFSKWPFMEIWYSIDWKNMWGFVAPSVLWFWIPAHTLTFSLKPEYRIIMAAALSICLGAILSFAKKRSSVSI